MAVVGCSKGDDIFGRQVRCVCHHIIVLLSFANKKATPFGMANRQFM
jgi:hypothetical protein